mgnify:CR=1 FL=1
MRGDGHENGLIPQTEIDARSLTDDILVQEGRKAAEAVQSTAALSRGAGFQAPIQVFFGRGYGRLFRVLRPHEAGRPPGSRSCA